MAVTAKGGGAGFEAPPVGVHPALCIDVIDLGEVKTPFKDNLGRDKVQHQINIVWQLHVEDENGNILTRTDGKAFRLSNFYNLSLNEQANLRKDLESWRGKAFTEEEVAEGFDVEKLIGVPCQINVVEQKGKAKVTAVMKASRRDPEIEVDPDFTREKDRPGGRDVRSPAADGATNGKAGAKSTAPKQSGDLNREVATTPAGGGGAPPFDSDDDDLPF